MKRISVEIRGVTSLLIHRFTEQTEQGKPTRRQIVQNDDPRTEATKNAYIAKDGTYYFNSYSIAGAMGNAGSNHKMRGSRKSLRFVVQARPHGFELVLAELARHPGRWAMLRTYRRVPSAHASATRLRTRLGYERYEFVVRGTTNGSGVLYGRCRREAV